MKGIMYMAKKAYDKEFKEGAVQYYLDHPEESKVSIAKRFGTNDSSVGKWIKNYTDNNNEIVVRGSGNYSSDEAKEIARLKKELKDTQDALNILKKAISILGN
jgi:transposase